MAITICHIEALVGRGFFVMSQVMAKKQSTVDNKILNNVDLFI